jgi:hypothetical protein
MRRLCAGRWPSGGLTFAAGLEPAAVTPRRTLRRASVPTRESPVRAGAFRLYYYTSKSLQAATIPCTPPGVSPQSQQPNANRRKLTADR